MGLFGRKKNDYEEASKKLNETPKAVDKMIISEMEDDDEKAAKLIDQLKEGCPLVLNFEQLDSNAANKLLAFFAGACYAVGGRCVTINEKTFMFARKVDFLDGSLQDFLKSLEQE